jgi:hypothetical protein
LQVIVFVPLTESPIMWSPAAHSTMRAPSHPNQATTATTKCASTADWSGKYTG